MSRFLDALNAEASQYGLRVERVGRTRRVTQFRFVPVAGGDPIAWACETSDAPGWIGFTARPEVTGRKVGNRDTVAQWCMDWACNGF